MRVILIPGLGEDERIFDGLSSLIEGEKTVLNTWTILGDRPRGKTSAYEIAQELISTYKITRSDVLIGHSLGGLIAYYAKEIVGCPIVQISSYTDHSRIVVPISNFAIIRTAIKNHLFFNDGMRWLIVQLHYRNKPSKGSLLYAFDMLKKGNPDNVINQITAALIPCKDKLTVQPDLRIHSKDDHIVRPPKEPYVEVPGDHFNLATHPAEVAKPINEFLTKVYKETVGRV